MYLTKLPCIFYRNREGTRVILLSVLPGLCVRQLHLAQAVRKTILLRFLRHPLQGGEEQVQGGQEGQNPSPKVSRLMSLES